MAGGPYGLVVRDLNGDGRLDVVVANGGSSTVNILWGLSGGTLSAAVNYAVGNSPYSVDVGDLNGDGRLDIVTSNYNNWGSIIWGNTLCGP